MIATYFDGYGFIVLLRDCRRQCDREMKNKQEKLHSTATHVMRVTKNRN